MTFKTTIRVLALAALVAAAFWTQRALAAGPKAKLPAPAAGQAKATFAGGCFWCMEPPFEKLPGVISVTSGYTGGKMNNPSYEQVSSGLTGHTEAVEIVYDPTKVSYPQLLDIFWHNIDPTAVDRQFCDQGKQYRSGIFFQDEAQKNAALASKAALQKSKPFAGAVTTEITAASTFWPAEEYHQDYYKKNPVRYNFYRTGCGRDERLRELWGASAGGH